MGNMASASAPPPCEISAFEPSRSWVRLAPAVTAIWLSTTIVAVLVLGTCVGWVGSIAEEVHEGSILDEILTVRNVHDAIFEWL